MLIDGKERKSVWLNRPDVGLYIGNNIWREIVTEVEIVQISGSVGVILSTQEDDYQKLVQKADAAMYYSKDMGKNQIFGIEIVIMNMMLLI